MKDFMTLLQQNNIKTPRLIKKKFFDSWTPIAEKYYELVETWNKAKRKWDRENERLFTEWGKVIPDLPKEPELKFKNPDECLAQIKRITEDIESRNIWELAFQIENAARKEWLSKIIKQAPENCKKILVFQKVSDEANKLLHQTDIPCGAIFMGMVVTAEVFNPQKPLMTEYWTMTPRNSTIEYL